MSDLQKKLALTQSIVGIVIVLATAAAAYGVTSYRVANTEARVERLERALEQLPERLGRIETNLEWLVGKGR